MAFSILTHLKDTPNVQILSIMTQHSDTPYLMIFSILTLSAHITQLNDTQHSSNQDNGIQHFDTQLKNAAA